MTELFVDAGGTNTRVWSQNFHKTVPSDLPNLPRILRKLIQIKPDELVIGLKGVWTSAEKAAWKKKLRGLAPKITVFSDIELAHQLAFGDKPGIVINAGTGAIAFGRDGKGKTARAGGLGPLIGDEGSAFWIGREYLNRRYWKDGDWAFVRKFAVSPDPVRRIASLAKQVIQKAKRAPSSMERKIVREAQRRLLRLAANVKTQLRLKNKPPIYLAGGLFEDEFFSAPWRKSRSRA